MAHSASDGMGKVRAQLLASAWGLKYQKFLMDARSVNDLTLFFTRPEDVGVDDAMLRGLCPTYPATCVCSVAHHDVSQYSVAVLPRCRGHNRETFPGMSCWVGKKEHNCGSIECSFGVRAFLPICRHCPGQDEPSSPCV